MKSAPIRPPARLTVHAAATRARGALRAPAALVFALALAGCATVGPDYVPMQIAVPPQWQAAPEAGPRDAAVLAQWWRQFDDAVLDGLIADALGANLDLATTRAQLREARARRVLAGAQLAPSVSVSGGASRGTTSAESSIGTTRELYTAGFDASWEPDVFGGLRRGLEAADADLDVSAEGLRDARVTLVAEVARNYVELRTAEQRLAIAESRLDAQAETFDLTRWRQQAGLVSELDAAQARTVLETTRAGLPSLRTAIIESRHRLAVLLGRPPGELTARLAATAAIPVAGEGVSAGIPADTLRQRPDVRAAERRLAAQTARLGEAQALRYPSFQLAGSLGLESLALDRLTTGGAVTRSLLASITAPIFDAGRITANIGIEDAVLEQSGLAYRSTVLTALEDVENALVAVANSTLRRDELTRAAASAREALQIAEHRYAAGLADFLPVLDGQRTVLDLEDQLASGIGELASAQIRLYKALGGGWTATDEAIVSGEAS